MRTIGGMMDANRGIGPGFDMLRVGLAFAVVLRHCFPISYGNGATSGYAWAATVGIVPSFFILSGFLVTGSAMRLTLGRFVASRALRIVPALVVDTLVTVLILGPLLTHQTLSNYFAAPLTHTYLLNMVGEIHYFLPGLFADNPLKGVVNGALWTIQPELGCYAVMCLLIILGWVKEWRMAALVLVAAVAVILIGPWLPRIPVVSAIITYPGAMLVPSFMLGSLLYLKRHLVPYQPWIFAFSISVVVVSGIFLPESTFSSLPSTTILMSPIYAYITLFIGATRLPPMPLFDRGDYSYGIYLYGFPVQQAIVASTGIQSPLLLFVCAVVPVVAIAILSWHFVEKPTLRLRKGFSMAAKIDAGRAHADDRR